MERSIPYHKALRFKEWLDKREAIKRRDEGKCVVCGSSEKLEVHHGYYKPQAMPWEYEDDSLFTLCHDCHHKQQNTLVRIHKTIGLMHPSEYENLIPFLPPAIFESTQGVSIEEAYILIHEFHDYCATINMNPEFNQDIIIETKKKGCHEFPGLTIDIEINTEEVHGAVNVFGPIDEVVDRITEYLESQVSR